MRQDNQDITVMQTPRIVDIAITGQCNLRCAYCSHFSSPGEVPEDLTTVEWLSFFGELNRLTVMNVILQGGEPFCRTDLKRLLEGIVENRMRFLLEAMEEIMGRVGPDYPVCVRLSGIMIV